MSTMSWQIDPSTVYWIDRPGRNPEPLTGMDAQQALDDATPGTMFYKAGLPGWVPHSSPLLIGRWMTDGTGGLPVWVSKYEYELKHTIASPTPPSSWASPTMGTMRWIPSGTFVMGSPANEQGRHSDETQHRVTLTKGFYLMEHPVTQAQWVAVMGNNPSSFKGAGKERYPVEQVSWDDVQEFIKRLNVRDKHQYRLPTEAEWEYAARSGQNFCYAGSENLDEVAWCSTNSGDTTHPVGQKKPNAWGLYDMSGNVWEWVQDLYAEYPGDISDYVNNSSGPYRVNVTRGGCWGDDPVNARVASRSWFPPCDCNDYLGFRLARSL